MTAVDKLAVRVGRANAGKGGQRGSAALELPLIVCLLLLPFAMLVLTIPTWVERQMAARDAAGELARLLVVTEVDVDSGPRLAALLARIEVSHGLAVGALRLAEAPSGSLTPGDQITVRVSVDLPGPSVPMLGDLGTGSWTASHTERVPDYRSGP